MPIVTHCPKCRGTFRFPESMAGKSAKCSRCQQVFVVPAAAAPPAARPADDIPMATLADEPPDRERVGFSARLLGPRPQPAAAPVPPPRRPAYSAPPQARPRPSKSGGSWVVALAVGIPMLVLLLAALGLGGVSAWLYYHPSAPSTQPAAVAVAGGGMPAEAPRDQAQPAPANPPPANANPNPAPPNGNPQPPNVAPAPPEMPPPPPRVLPPALKPPAPADVAAPKLGQDKIVKQFPSAISDMAVGGGGRFLILYLPGLKRLAVFDVNVADVTHDFTFEEAGLKFAAGVDQLIVALPKSRVLKRYSLKTFKEEDSAPLPIPGAVDALCMGSASNGPLWVQTNGEQGQGGASALVDPSTLKEWAADWGDKQQPTGGAYLRASEDGQVFAQRDGAGGEPHTVTTVVLQGGAAALQQKWGLDSSLVVPDAHGGRFYTGCAVYDPDLAPVFPNPVPQSFCKPFLPAVGGPYFVRLDYKEWDQVGGDLSFFLPGGKEPFATLKDVEGVTNEQIAYGSNRDTLTHDQRIHFLPAAKVVVAVPKTNDRLILYRFDPEAALEKSNLDYLVVTSQAPPAARAGQEYAYQLAVKSKKGGVKYRLDSGPKGMAIDAAGKLTWTPAADAPKENDVVVSVRDASGQEVAHSFRVGVE